MCCAVLLPSIRTASVRSTLSTCLPLVPSRWILRSAASAHWLVCWGEMARISREFKTYVNKSKRGFFANRRHPYGHPRPAKHPWYFYGMVF